MAIEDYNRHKADSTANATRTRIYNSSSGAFEEKRWADVQVGDILKVEDKEIFPADLLFISAAYVPDPSRIGAHVAWRAVGGRGLALRGRGWVERVAPRCEQPRPPSPPLTAAAAPRMCSDDAHPRHCFVNTKSLDGETDNKLRLALKCTASAVHDMKQFHTLLGGA